VAGVRASLPLLGALALAVGTACQGGGGGAGTPARSAGFPAPSREAVWEVAAQSLREQGFVPDPESSAADAGVVESRWKISLQPFAGTGRRDRALVRVKEVAGSPGHFTVETEVTRQINQELAQPGSLGAAEWGETQRVPDLEALINRRVEYYFVDPVARPEFRARYAPPAAPER
jgi:hypothetical protein